MVNIQGPAAPGTSVSSEQVFSSAGNIVNKRCTCSQLSVTDNNMRNEVGPFYLPLSSVFYFFSPGSFNMIRLFFKNIKRHKHEKAFLIDCHYLAHVNTAAL